MMQILADHIDQLDLALDQLAVHDRNFDRFAIMLIDNVVELTLHRYAEESTALFAFLNGGGATGDNKLILDALGQRFDAKVKLAKSKGLLPGDALDSILSLHSFRNTAYHQGVRHEGILHSLALFYFRIACDLLIAYKPRSYSWGSRNKLSHRAKKYLGNAKGYAGLEVFEHAWARLREVAESMGDNLANDLHEDLEGIVTHFNENLDYIADGAPDGKKKRGRIILESQAWHYAFTDEAKHLYSQKKGNARTVLAYVEWFIDNRTWSVSTDPVPGWKKRLTSLKAEKNPHAALKKYRDFVSQTEYVRESVEASARRQQDHIDHLTDIARGK